ncbi:hypothetical protein [Yunchengibacter salinarum]|uniref:hypothetical protein n=1 Tax=Yunchengibacter salinarum TaxID=3133399 RepID=UPI0035B5F402
MTRPTAQSRLDDASHVTGTGLTDATRDLARRLIAHMGREEARQICRENGWDGVLTAIDRHA